MENNYQEEKRYYEAQKKVKEIKSFYVHLTVYLLTNPIVIAVNLITSPEYLWCLWCLLGWAIPIVLHGLIAFDYPPFFNKEWEKRKIKEFIDKEEQSRNNWE
ncbi:2TM domain-containing protein [Flavobacterium sp. WC2421]|jgi:hypothetical protein|uniref:2TM domain-containing protein n=3 Tax=unclassified Flavobacterium TaxID=196869 RepID=A0AB39WBP0_9FLAO